MKRKSVLILTLVLSLCLSLLLTSCEENPCAHEFENNCDEQCALCGFERVISHDWKEASCYNPRMCRNCDLTDGEALLHSLEPDCESNDSCINCNMVAYAIGHRPDENGICTICGQPILATMSEE